MAAGWRDELQPTPMNTHPHPPPVLDVNQGPHPFGLSLSKSSADPRPFDKLRANG